MCLIIRKPKTVSTPIKLLENAFQYNENGWGLMYAENGKVVVTKGYGVEGLIYNVEALQKDRELFIHMRRATKGAKTIDMAHPFELGKSGIWMMHNGTIRTINPEKQDSDTATIATWLTPLIESNPEIIFFDGFKKMVEQMIGNSRIVFLHPDGRFTTITDRTWGWYKDVRVSNFYAWDLWLPEYPKNTKEGTVDWLLKKPYYEIYKLIKDRPAFVAQMLHEMQVHLHAGTFLKKKTFTTYTKPASTTTSIVPVTVDIPVVDTNNNPISQ